VYRVAKTIKLFLARKGEKYANDKKRNRTKVNTKDL
jgi:hypothetical protein